MKKIMFIGLGFLGLRGASPTIDAINIEKIVIPNITGPNYEIKKWVWDSKSGDALISYDSSATLFDIANTIKNKLDKLESGQFTIDPTCFVKSIKVKVNGKVKEFNDLDMYKTKLVDILPTHVKTLEIPEFNFYCKSSISIN